MRSAPTIAALCLALGLANAASAQTTTNIIVTPTSTVFDANNTIAVPGDSAPGFPFASFASNGVAKTDIYFVPEALFGRAITIGEVASISYWTKTGATHAVDPRDWYLAIYTKPYAGDASSASWYGDRFGSEPYFSAALNDPADTWNNWTTYGAENRLRFFESTAGGPGATFGSYTDPDWTSFVAANALSGFPRTSREILFFSVQTGSGWAAGFTGQLDGLRIVLMDGSIANINFEEFNWPATKDACKNGGWQTLVRANGTPFKNQGACVSYVNTGK